MPRRPTFPSLRKAANDNGAAPEFPRWPLLLAPEPRSLALEDPSGSADGMLVRFTVAQLSAEPPGRNLK
jgi:hypothetical protein